MTDNNAGADAPARRRIGYAGTPCENYGGTLQAYALAKAVEGLGYDCELVGQGNEMRSFDRLGQRKLAWSLFSGLDRNRKAAALPFGKLSLPTWRRLFDKEGWWPAFSIARFKSDCMREIFQAFWQRHFAFSESLPKIDVPTGTVMPEARSAYDAYLCGSDQIWNPSLKFWSADPKVYLQFAPPGKRVAYAPSISVSILEPQMAFMAPQFREHLRGLAPHLSCRERQGAEMITRLTGLPATTVMDPVYLLPRAQWGEAMREGVMPRPLRRVRDGGQPYLFAYFLNIERYQEALPRVKRIASRRGLRIAWLVGSNGRIHANRNSWQTCPGGFMQLLEGASFVCTDGFHGTSLSLIFEKPFLFMGKVERKDDGGVEPVSTRLVNILNLLGLSDRVADPAQPDRPLPEIDYRRVAEIRDREAERSRGYLRDALAAAVAAPADAENPPPEPAFSSARPPGTVNPHPYRVPLMNTDRCTGCGACRNLCPVDAIAMRPDPDGFSYPEVDEGRCVKCGRCRARCPVVARPRLSRTPNATAYAAWSLDYPLLGDSSSGGLFSLLAERWALSRGGAAFGAAFDGDLAARHVAARAAGELAPLRRSKYVQSDIGLAYREAGRMLREEGRPVFFVGTGCQVSGLYAFLGEDPPNLLTAALVCHGVASPMLLRKYVEWRERQAGAKMIRLTHRSKRRAPNLYGVEMGFANGCDWYVPGARDEYLVCFLGEYFLRPSCYACGFQRDRRWRSADLLLGDFWGLGAKTPFPHDRSQGVSAVLTATRKAELLFEQIRSVPGLAQAFPRPAAEMLDGNAHALREGPPKPPPALRGRIRRIFREKPFDEAYAEVYGGPDVLERPTILKRSPGP